MDRIRAFLLCIVAALLTATTLYAQTSVSGTVYDATGNPLPGATVVVKDGTIGALTDADGKYQLYLPQGAKALEFSFLGYKTLTANIGRQSVINVYLEEDTNYLDEVVVVGYGVQKKAHLTGSVVAVSTHELQKATVSNVSQALVGKLPGLVTQQSQGLPGADQVSLLVRGYSSYNDAGTVLVLVDGVERDMNTVNPADIESISVLKDAASCAVYGMKGANGVILVTTKRGNEGNAKVSYSGRMTLSTATALPKMMTGDQYMQYYNLAYSLDRGTPGEYFTQAEIEACTNGDPTDGFENTDWTEPLFRTTMMHQHNISVSGGSSKVSYFLSGGFMEQNGFFRDHKYQRTNFRSNVDAKPMKNLALSFNVVGTYTDNYSPGVLSYSNGQTGGTVPFCLLYALPFVPHEYEGDVTSPMRTSGAFVANAEYGAAHSGFSQTNKMQLNTDFKATYSFPFLKGLSASFAFDWDWADTGSKTFAYAYYLRAYNFANKAFESGLSKCSNALEEGNLYVGDLKSQRTMIRPQLSYANKFGKHDVSALFLYEQNVLTSSKLDGGRQGFDLLDLAELSLGNATTATNSGSSGKSAYAGYVFRTNYAYDDRYLAEFSARYDGSWNFAKSHRWGFFPSVSLGWNIAKESWFKEAAGFVDSFKLRGSVGEVGNDNVASFLYRKSYAFSTNSVAFGQIAQNTIYNAITYPFEDLTWERIRTSDVGVEFSAWKGLLTLEADYFYKFTYDILDSIAGAYPPSLGGHYPTQQNTGEFDSRGFEISVKHYNHVGDFNYSLSANMSYNNSRILKRNEAVNTVPWQSVIGTAYGTVWGLKSDGLYQTQEEIDNAILPDGVSSVRLGDIRYKDINGDGKINTYDIVKIGRGVRPHMQYAFQFDCNWRGFDFSVQFQGAALSDKLLIGSWANGVSDSTPLAKPFYAGFDNSPLYLVEQSWRPDNTDATYPRLSISNSSSYTNNYQVSDFWLRDTSYLRLKNLTFGYTIPTRIIRKAGLGGLRAYVSGANLLTFTGFKYLDPESPSVVTGYYPQQKTFTFGLDINF